MAKNKFDFSGYATKNDLKCTDGRVIIKDAFKHNDGDMVPLVWQHLHNDPSNILGHAILENKEDGVYAYGKFNDTAAGKNAKELVAHGDIKAMSIYANQLKQQGSNVLHGAIREVSLVISPANSGAIIDNLCFSHGDGSHNIDETEAIIYTGLNVIPDEQSDIEEDKDPVKHADTKEDDNVTVQEVFDSMTSQQKNVVYAMIGQALEEELEHSDEEIKGGDQAMKHNVFDKQEEETDNTLSHSDMKAILSDAKKYGSIKESALAHGIDQIEYLFPDARLMTPTPLTIHREMGWVPKVMNATHRTPFSRIRSLLADLTEDEARARGYITGNRKSEEVFGLLKRTTTPQTIYKKQKLDRDDVVDITDFDVVAWLKSEMRTMLDEEIARAILIGDGRLTSSDDKIREDNIRPIWKDEDLFTIKSLVESNAGWTQAQKTRAFIRAVVRARKYYKGSGDPTLFTTEDVLTEALLMEDTTGRVIYDSIAKLATVLRVREIITVPVMENQTRINTEGQILELMAILVNLTDYNVGADRGGAVNMFEDFDIDYNAQKYLIETRISGALIRPFSAIAIEKIADTVTTSAVG